MKDRRYVLVLLNTLLQRVFIKTEFKGYGHYQSLNAEVIASGYVLRSIWFPAAFVNGIFIYSWF